MKDHAACTVKLDRLWTELLKVVPDALAKEMGHVFRAMKEVVNDGGPCPYHIEKTET